MNVKNDRILKRNRKSTTGLFFIEQIIFKGDFLWIFG